MTTHDESAQFEADLRARLTSAREALLWKVAGLDESGARRPMTPTGTNLLGLVQHLSVVQAVYLGFCCGRPLPDPPSWMDASMPRGADLVVDDGDSTSSVLDLFQRTCTHADQTVERTALEAVVPVPWVPTLGPDATLHRVLVHVVGEFERHLGHADIIRELLDGLVGKHPDEHDLGGPPDLARQR